MALLHSFEFCGKVNFTLAGKQTGALKTWGGWSEKRGTGLETEAAVRLSE